MASGWAQHAEMAVRSGPIADARERVLPVIEPLQPLLPYGGLRRGGAFVVRGPAAMSLALALAAGAGQAGSWTGVLGMPGLGLAAAAELGVPLQRLLLVAAPPPSRWAEIVSVLADGTDVVLAQPPDRLAPGEARRLQARLGVRGSVLVLVESGARCVDTLSLDAHFATADAEWRGVEQGSGRLTQRAVDVSIEGRRGVRPRTVQLWLPGNDGAVSRRDAVSGGSTAPGEQSHDAVSATVTPLRQVG